MLQRSPDKRCAHSTLAGADQAVIELRAGGDLAGTLYVNRAGPYTLTNAALLTRLGAETGFNVRDCLIQFFFTTEHTKVTKELLRDRLGLSLPPSSWPS